MPASHASCSAATTAADERRETRAMSVSSKRSPSALQIRSVSNAAGDNARRASFTFARPLGGTSVVAEGAPSAHSVELDRRARITLCRHNDLAHQATADRGVRLEQAADEQLDGLFFERIDRTIACRRCPANGARFRRDGSDERETPHLRHHRDRLEGAQIVRSGEMCVVDEYGNRLMLDERGKLSYLRSKILPGKGCGATGGAEHFDRRLDLRALAKQARFSASARSGENRNRAGAECGVVKQAVKVGQLLLASYAVLGFGSSRMMGRHCPYKLRFGNYIILLFPIGGMRNV